MKWKDWKIIKELEITEVNEFQRYGFKGWIGKYELFFRIYKYYGTQDPPEFTCLTGNYKYTRKFMTPSRENLIKGVLEYLRKYRYRLKDEI